MLEYVFANHLTLDQNRIVRENIPLRYIFPFEVEADSVLYILCHFIQDFPLCYDGQIKTFSNVILFTFVNFYLYNPSHAYK
jgi:hypothetical protein